MVRVVHAYMTQMHNVACFCLTSTDCHSICLQERLWMTHWDSTHPPSDYSNNSSCFKVMSSLTQFYQATSVFISLNGVPICFEHSLFYIFIFFSFSTKGLFFSGGGSGTKGEKVIKYFPLTVFRFAFFILFPLIPQTMLCIISFYEFKNLI